MDMKRGRLINGLKVMLNPESGDALWRKFAEDRRQVLVGEHAQWRSDKCWLCDRRPDTWVREVIFDIADIGEPDMKTALVVNSETYTGPVPGFCHLHLGAGPRELAQIVYNDSLVVAWGYRPSRWFVVFTDGTRVEGRAREIDPNPERAPITHDEHLQGAHDVK
jgi:hypothetical protein